MQASARVPKANVLGVGISAINLAEGTRLILEAVRENRRGYIAVTGVHGVSKPLADWYQSFDDVENHVLDLKDRDACRAAAKGAAKVYNLAADMGVWALLN